MIPLGVLAARRPAVGGGVLTFTHAAGITSKTSGVWRFTNVNIGAEAADRYVIVHTSTRDSSPPTAVVVNGESAAELVVSTSQGNHGAFWSAVIPTGTSVTVDVTQAGTNRANIAVYTLTGFGALSTVTSGSASAPASFTDIADVSLTGMSAGDLVIAGSCHFGTTNATRCTWTNVAEDYDGVFATGQLLVSSGGTAIAAGSSLTISTTWDSPRLAGPTVAVALRRA